VLVFDEADSFLQDRSSTNRLWEISQVNEMLVQMESFNGFLSLQSTFVKALIKRV
jgi:hypothetical protein